MATTITKESLNAMLLAADAVKRQHIIGRALVRLFERQTSVEQARNDTENKNWVGFSASDAKSGSLTAKYYLKHRKLEDWMVNKWMTITNGYPRLCRYSRQLNQIVSEREAA